MIHSFSDRQIILDTETTGLSLTDGHRVIEIGALELCNRRRTEKYFHCYFNPERKVDEEALAIHGITDEFLLEQPLFGEKVADFLIFITGAELIIHNATFDIGFLDYELQRLQKNYLPIANICKITDSLVLARQKHPGQQNSLDALCRRYQVNNSHRQYHGALLDAELLAEVYLAMTGGQSSLFVNEQHDEKEVVSKTFHTEQHGPLPIIFADESERVAHRNYLAKIQQKSQVVLWLDDG